MAETPTPIPTPTPTPTQRQERREDVAAGTRDEETPETPPFLFVCKTDSARMVGSILSALQFQKFANVSVSDAGLKVTVEASKSIQATAYLKKELFLAFRVRESCENYDFRVNLALLLECLTIFGTAAPYVSLQMCCTAPGEPLVLLLEENGVLADCAVRTLEWEQPADIMFQASPVAARLILQSDALRDAFNDLGWSGGAVLLSLTPEGLRLEGDDARGSCWVEIPRESEVFLDFNCTQHVSHRYSTTLLLHCTKALSLSRETSLRVNTRGTLSLQHMIHTETGETCFVEFLLCANVPESDEES